MFKTTFAISLLALTAVGWQQQKPRSFLALKEEKMILEHNVSLGEAVVRLEAESEEELDRVQISRPDGERALVLVAPNGTARGLSSFKIELQEASLESILATYAEGSYEIRGTTGSGNLARGRASLSFDLPPAPRVLFPYEGAVVPASRWSVRWLADRSVSGYRVQMEQGETDGLVIHLPPGSSSFVVPDGFLARATETQLEIAAVGPNGNRTVVEVHFVTQ